MQSSHNFATTLFLFNDKESLHLNYRSKPDYDFNVCRSTLCLKIVSVHRLPSVDIFLCSHVSWFHINCAEKYLINYTDIKLHIRSTEESSYHNKTDTKSFQMQHRLSLI